MLSGVGAHNCIVVGEALCVANLVAMQLVSPQKIVQEGRTKLLGL